MDLLLKDLGFKFSGNYWFRGDYDLRNTGGDYWLLRRRVKRDGKVSYLVTFYLRIDDLGVMRYILNSL